MISLLRQCNSFLISRNSILLVSFRYRSTASQNFMTSLGRLVTTNWYPCYVSGSLGLSVNWRVKDCPLFKFEKENATVCCEKNLALPIGPDWLKILAHIRKFCSLTSLVYIYMYTQLVYGHGKSVYVSDPTTHSLSLLEYFLVTRPPMYCHS